MRFWKPKGPHGCVNIHFQDSPEHDFGAYAEGYARAAKSLARDFLSCGSADNMAYPIVFLYRHALELSLKNIILRGNYLGILRMEDASEKVRYNHDLEELLEIALRVLKQRFPNDHIEALSQRLEVLTTDLAALDRSSYVFRYPVNRSGGRPVEEPIAVSIAALARQLDPLLRDLDSVDLALDAEIGVATENLSHYLHDLDCERDG